MKLSFVKDIAHEILEKILPYCDTVKIVGSVRRLDPQPGDLEFVLVRKQSAIVGFVEVMNAWQKVKGDAIGSMTTRRIQGLKVEFYMTNADNFGMHHAVRTGSEAYAKALATRWSGMGYKSIKGYLHERDLVSRGWKAERLAFRTEEDLFDFLGVRWKPPDIRISNLLVLT